MAPILVYHSVAIYDEPRPAGIDCPPKQFREHMEWLSQNYRVISLRELMENYISKGISAPKDVAVITFDDGYLDNFEEAFPILKSLQLPATVFCVTKYIGSTWPAHDWGGLAKPMLSAEQMVEMASHGIDFGSHGHSHAELTSLEPKDLNDELQSSHQRLTDILGRGPSYISYPFGSFNEFVVKEAERVGFAAGFTVWTKDPQLFSLNRLPIHRNDRGIRFQLKVKHYEWVKPILATFRS